MLKTYTLHQAGTYHPGGRLPGQAAFQQLDRGGQRNGTADAGPAGARTAGSGLPQRQQPPVVEVGGRRRDRGGRAGQQCRRLPAGASGHREQAPARTIRTGPYRPIPAHQPVRHRLADRDCCIGTPEPT